jgi:2-polyprenyl-3-methyl-5-hydroxy-6-metoxy-1,4-benzoquinol methylase
MPTSLRDNDEDVRGYVRRAGVRTALDVGAGSGTYANVLAGTGVVLDAVEVWLPYVIDYGLGEVYRSVTTADVRSLARVGYRPKHAPYDLVIFGDVLEHMSAEEGLAVWKWAATIADAGLISAPTVHWPQGAEGGNPHEAHVQDHLGADEWEAAFGPFDEVHQYEKTATMIRRFR